MTPTAAQKKIKEALARRNPMSGTVPSRRVYATGITNLDDWRDVNATAQRAFSAILKQDIADNYGQPDAVKIDYVERGKACLLMPRVGHTKARLR